VPAETHSHRDTTPEDVRRVVADLAAELLGVDVDVVDDHTVLPDDAVAVLELVEACEEELAERGVGFTSEDDVAEWRTVGDVVAHVLALTVPVDDAGADGPDGPDDPYLGELERAIGHRFADRSLLRLALHHRSYVAETTGAESNERLEFLGDAVLGIIVTDELFREFPTAAEGVLAKARAAVVNAEFLAEAAVALGLGEHMHLGKGEDASGGREKPSILADAIEAVIGAVYCDGGLAAVTPFVLSVVGPSLPDAVLGEGSKDYKTRLQELVARSRPQPPVYRTAASGPDHAKQFTATVSVGDEIVGEGTGRSKKQAEQGAARAAWERLGDLSGGGVRDRGPATLHNERIQRGPRRDEDA
jgi:ribonuclease-3